MTHQPLTDKDIGALNCVAVRCVYKCVSRVFVQMRRTCCQAPWDTVLLCSVHSTILMVLSWEGQSGEQSDAFADVEELLTKRQVLWTADQNGLRQGKRFFALRFRSRAYTWLKVKGKVFLPYSIRRIGGVQVQLLSFLTSALHAVRG
jgi:hypothetical protein